MAQEYSKIALLKFLDFVANKGLMKKSTVTSRKAAINTLLSILTEDEQADLRGLDIDAVVQRFANLKPHEMKPASLNVYKSRLASSLKELERFNRDPTGYRPQVAARTTSRTKTNGENAGTSESKIEDAAGINSVNVDPKNKPDEVETIVFPIPLRPGIIVRVSGIPSDLTPEEAEKIGSVVLALSGSQET